VFQLIRDINATGTAVVLATHDLDLVRQTHYRTIELQDGAIVYDSKEAAMAEDEGLL
jgi:ABC-type ATPase involved in cell division